MSRVLAFVRAQVLAWREGKTALAENRARDEIARLERIWSLS